MLAVPALFGNGSSRCTAPLKAAPRPAARPTTGPFPPRLAARSANRLIPTATADKFAVRAVAHPRTLDQTQIGFQIYRPLRPHRHCRRPPGKAQRAVNYAVGLHTNSVRVYTALRHPRLLREHCRPLLRNRATPSTSPPSTHPRAAAATSCRTGSTTSSPRTSPSWITSPWSLSSSAPQRPSSAPNPTTLHGDPRSPGRINPVGTRFGGLEPRRQLRLIAVPTINARRRDGATR